MLRRLRRLRSDASGFTLIELLVGTSMALVVCFGAYTILQFTTEDIARQTSRVHVAQNGRIALERLMEHLHSACVAALVTPVLSQSSATVLRFISEASEGSSITRATLHKITYTPPPPAKKARSSKGAGKAPKPSQPPNYVFNEVESPKTTILLKGISRPKRRLKAKPKPADLPLLPLLPRR